MSKRRSPAMAGAIGIFVVLLATLSAFFLDSLPFVGAGSSYSAEFSEAAGLKPGNEVRIMRREGRQGHFRRSRR